MTERGEDRNIPPASDSSRTMQKREILRQAPGAERRQTRKELLAKDHLELRIAQIDILPLPSFELGNKKTGKSGGRYSSILVWNIPPVITCPDAHPEATFWGYTRSWMIPELKEPLEALRARGNLQLFASWDHTMPEPPDDWRISYVHDPAKPGKTPENLIACPEEYKEHVNCANCGFCLRPGKKGVSFNVH